MINKYGFLSPLITEAIREIRANHRRLFEIAERANEIMMTTASSARFDITVDQHRAAIGLFLRSLELFQAIILLSERGMEAPATGQVRSLLEIAYTLTILRADPTFVHELEVSAALARRQHLEKLFEPLPEPERATHEGLSDDERTSYRKQIREIDAFVAARKRGTAQAKRLEPWELAARANSVAMHRVVYPGNSASVHVDLRDIFESYGEGVPADRFSYGPNPQRVIQLLSQGVHFAIAAFEQHEHIFGREIAESSEIVGLWHEAMKISPQ